jgi:hypothetical protein
MKTEAAKVYKSYRIPLGKGWGIDISLRKSIPWSEFEDMVKETRDEKAEAARGVRPDTEEDQGPVRFREQE